MKVTPQPGQKVEPVYSVIADLHFGGAHVRLPMLHVNANTLTDAANMLKDRSDKLGKMVDGAHLTLIEVSRGPSTESQSGPSPLALLGQFVATHFMEWLQTGNNR